MKRHYGYIASYIIMGFNLSFTQETCCRTVSITAWKRKNSCGTPPQISFAHFCVNSSINPPPPSSALKNPLLTSHFSIQSSQVSNPTLRPPCSLMTSMFYRIFFPLKPLHSANLPPQAMILPFPTPSFHEYIKLFTPSLIPKKTSKL